MVAAIFSQPLAPAQEAAILFAEDRDAEALLLLQGLIGNIAANADPQLWRLALDLYRITGDKGGFDRTSAAFVARVDAAHPEWDPSVDESRLIPELRRDGKAFVELVGDLDVTGAIALNAQDVLSQHAIVRIDATRLQSLDKQACSVLFDTTVRLMEAGGGIHVTGAGRLAHCLQKLLATNTAFRPAWDLLLKLWQLKDEEREYARAALEYSLAVGTQPPEWEPVVIPVVGIAAIEEKRGEPRYQLGPEVLRLSGTISSSQDFHLKELQNFALDRKYVNVDFTYLRRIDVAGARALVTLANGLIREGKVMRLLRQNSLILALLRLLELNHSVVCTPLAR